LGAKSGDGLMKQNLLRPIALFGVVAAMVSVTVVLTLARTTVTTSGLGNLKCYDKAGIEKAC
jgi:hypothetical protein